MTKLWRIWNSGDWDEFHTDVTGDTIDDALEKFDEKQRKRNSRATRKEVTKVELLGDDN